MPEEAKKHTRQSIDMSNGVVVEVSEDGVIEFVKPNQGESVNILPAGEEVILITTTVEELNRVNRVIWSGRILPDNVVEMPRGNRNYNNRNNRG